MRSIAGWAVLAIVLATGGAGFRTAGQLERGMNAAHKQLLQMDYAAAKEQLAAVTAIGPQAAARVWRPRYATEMQQLQAALAFWTSDYVALTPTNGDTAADGPSDASLMLLSADAAFRMDKPVPGNAASVQRLEQIMDAYADVLKQSPDDLTAAYNFEYVGRVRDRLVRPSRAARPPVTMPVTIHGTEGGRPQEDSMTPFQTLQPLEGDERRETEEAGKRTPRVRRG